MAFGSNEIPLLTDKKGSAVVLAVDFTSTVQGCMGH